MCKILITVFALTFLLSSNVVTADSTSTALPKSRNTAENRSLLCTFVPAAVGGALIIHGLHRGRADDTEGGLHNHQTDDTEALVGLAIGSAGIILGPGAGHAYAVKMERFWTGVAIRGTTASLTAVVALTASESSSMDDGIAQFMTALVVGGSICLISAIHDINSAGDSVDDYNKEHGFSSLTLRPTYFASHKAPGVMLTMSL